MSNPNEFSGSLQEIRGRIGEAAVRSRRKPEEVTLLAVTKTLSVATIQEAYDAGLRDFGENRVQEALEKMVLLPRDIRWHLIGQLQTNKINKTLGKFALIHSVDSLHLAEAVSSRVRGGDQDVLLEVNTSGEASKSGITPKEAGAAAEKISNCPGLKLRGLMTVGPLTDNIQRQREAFKTLKGLFDSLRIKKNLEENFSILSMGMSGDFESAIEEGSTLVRVGTALFGSRG
jgi:pyridoxal phosphate enzyme (YggS family)